MHETTVAAAGARERIAAHRRRFDPLFAAYFDRLAAAPGPFTAGRFPARCVELLRDQSLRGGKRLRVALLHEAARLVTDAEVPGLDEAALSVELLHTHGLVHDDIVDDAPLRRGAPSVYYAYRAEFPGQERTAVGLAVLAGDLAAFLSVQVLLEAPLPDGLRLALAQEQTRASAETVLGQFLDLERDVPPLPGDDFLHTVTEFKSARYSILAPLRLGLLAAGEDPEPYAGELRRYAVLVGIYEQMRDDYLDLFGDPAVTGKPVGTDLRDGRRTYAVNALLAGVDGADRKRVESALGDPGCDDATIAEIGALARRAGVDERLRATMLRYAREASDEAAGWRPRWREEAVSFFSALPLWSVRRTF
ncbi:polyprenyl synthetase family protein [Streptomyces clavuligerus]|uniref:Putative polyprenyl synthetase n=1 Tax=Streptomyces clavuligerus TaxID=1901 RepID=E2Q9H0_STRCL|nr:polyprenyl synthetase family protein [Streptomyces clavuligerus]ANW21290.1 polyprenyl synthetase [Streptomyces clavuligerus]AXU15918.1 polyprenyl synthetase family protein [Streptomyces clavuligerus]EFG05590.1 Putative polyprenyl synthetase [Streptomyces clavuligerus]MBY6306043.1 polyprenyl synthetase family protein [Streptomyces clavuligerus]QCS08698.1 polyprenyl synthetase family protein [Streptomyces clavuligerus]